jgi:N-glycosylase/DNA lyase
MTSLTAQTAIVVPKFELDLNQVLMSGQTFRWQLDDEGWWISPVGCDGSILRIRRENENLIIEQRNSIREDFVSNYFHLAISLKKLRDQWAEDGGEDLAEIIDSMPGIRVVRQDPVECLFSFICSSAAPIHRIRRSVDGMCRGLGRDLGTWHGTELFAFPKIEDLAKADPGDLSRMGLGFRGRYVIDTARALLLRGGRDWLENLRLVSHGEAKASLVQLPGIGEKVADCVCLFSLDKHHAVPIDVHMARVARRQFSDCNAYESISAKAYLMMSNCFRDRYGEFAGWAQQYFFYGEIESKGLWDQQLGKHRPKLSSPKPG